MPEETVDSCSEGLNGKAFLIIKQLIGKRLRQNLFVSKVPI